MRFALLAAALAAAATLTAAPAAAQSFGGPSSPGFGAPSRFEVAPRRGDRPDRRRVDSTVILDARGYADPTRSWQYDSFNDWWHERPHRAYPRWMQGNANCERQWWSGSGWRC